MPEARLKIATQKSGRLAEDSLDLLSRCGLSFSRSRDRLFCHGENMPVDLLRVRDDDIPDLLLNGVCDLGIVGGNLAREHILGRNDSQGPPYTTLRTLDFGACRLAIAVPEGSVYRHCSNLTGKRLATSYPQITGDFLQQHQIDASIVRLSGSVEIAPSLGTADAIVDLVSTGTTLRNNQLKEVETVFQSSAVLLQAPGELTPDRQALLDRLLQRIDGVLQVKESKYVLLHAPKAALARITALLPGAETPTILPLDDERVAVHAVCRESVFWEHLESLKSAGASAILVLPVEKMLP